MFEAWLGIPEARQAYVDSIVELNEALNAYNAFSEDIRTRAEQMSQEELDELISLYKEREKEKEVAMVMADMGNGS